MLNVFKSLALGFDFQLLPEPKNNNKKATIQTTPMSTGGYSIKLIELLASWD